MDQPTKRVINPIEGWPIDRLIELDEALPGLLRRLTTASDLRRQVAFHVVALLDTDHSYADLAKALRPTMEGGCLNDIEVVCHALLELRAKTIFEALYGKTTGLVGLHRRLGPAPRERQDYIALKAMFLGKQKKRIKTILNVEKIRNVNFSVVNAMPEFLLHPNIIRSVNSLDNLHTLMAVINLLKLMNPQFNETVFADSISHVTEWYALRDALTKWGEKGRYVHVPDFGDNPKLRVITTGQALTEAARRFKNCMETNYAGEAMLGQSAFVEYLPEPAMIHLQALSDNRWMLESINGIANSTVARETSIAVIRELRKHGVFLPRGIVDGNHFSAIYDLLSINILRLHAYGALEYVKLDDIDWTSSDEELIQNAEVKAAA